MRLNGSVKFLLGTLSLLLMASSCKLLGTGSCASYDERAEDRFQMNIDDSKLVLKTGESKAIKVNRSWMNDDGTFRDLNCSLAWTVEPTGMVKVDADANIITTSGSIGIARLTAASNGHSRAKDELWVAVIANPNEVEPNNARDIARPLAASTEVSGFAGGSDEDWYAADIPVGKGFQFTLTSKPTRVSGDSFNNAYSRGYFDKDGNGLSLNADAGRNNGSTLLRIYIRVVGSSADLPYSLSYQLVD